MPFDWTLVADAVEDSVTSNLGGEIEIRRGAKGVVTPIPGTDVQRTPQAAALSGTFNAVQVGEGKRYEDGGLIENNELMFIVSPGDFEPEVGDCVVAGGKTYEVLRVNAVRPNGTTPVVFECGVAI